MSTIVEVVEPSYRGSAPKLRIECAGCGRRYVANYWKGQVPKLKSCQVCAVRPRRRR